MANVEDVAEAIVNYMNSKEEPWITNSMLNKLLYFAQGHCLVETGKPMFEDDFEAWECGPVIPKIYHKYKICGKNGIDSASDIQVKDVLDCEQLPIMEDVLEEYSIFSASKLANIAREPSSPWDIARKQADREERPSLIAKGAMKVYFQTIPFLDDELYEEEIQAIKDYEKAVETGTLVTYTFEEAKERCGLANESTRQEQKANG